MHTRRWSRGRLRCWPKNIWWPGALGFELALDDHSPAERIDLAAPSSKSAASNGLEAMDGLEARDGLEVKNSLGTRSTASSIFVRLTPYLFLAQALTGIVLMFFYRPSPENAHLDLVDLREISRFSFVRGLHFWGSHAVVIVTWLAVLQLGIRGIRKRRSEWHHALALMLLTLAFVATGHVLPWDQQAAWWIWSLTTPANAPADASTVPAVDLLNFYILHCFLLPIAAGALIVRVLRDTRFVNRHGPPADH